MALYRETLIAKVRALGYSDREIARRIGMDPGQYARIASGKEGLPVDVAALLADLVGIDPLEAMKHQAIENAKEPRRSLLERALFTCGVLGVNLALLGTPTATDAKAIGAAHITDGVRAVCILCKLVAIATLRTLARRLGAGQVPSLALAPKHRQQPPQPALERSIEPEHDRSAPVALRQLLSVVVAIMESHNAVSPQSHKRAAFA